MKRFKIVFSSSALTDVKEASKWYNSQQKGLGSRFRKDVKSAIHSISSNPFRASIKYENMRTVACEHFPYSIHFEADKTEK